MTKPLILVTAGIHHEDSLQHEVQSVIVGVDINYLDAVLLAGGTPLLVPSVVDPEAVPGVLQLADGLLLTGGGDIHAAHYGEEPHPAGSRFDAARDAMEMEVARAALALGMPILGICRGLQMLNVVHGGTLYQDIPTQIPEAGKHLADGLTLVMLHPIAVEPDSLLARIIGATTLAVNSWHHQAVKAVGPGLRINARAHDGVVEGLESTTDTPVLAVQCHPEECTGTYPSFRPLFTWLTEEARKYQGRK